MRPGWIALTAGAAAFLSGCGWQPADIADVQFDARSTELQVLVDTCNRAPSVAALIGGDEIALSAEVPRRLSLAGADDCQVVLKLVLDEPVDRRAVVDAATGREFEPDPASE